MLSRAYRPISVCSSRRNVNPFSLLSPHIALIKLLAWMHSQMHRIYPKDCHRPSLYIFNQIFTFSRTRSPLTLGEDRAAEVRTPQFCVHWMSQSDREDRQRPDLSGNCDRIYGSVRLGGEAAELCVHLCVCAFVCVCVFVQPFNRLATCPGCGPPFTLQKLL